MQLETCCQAPVDFVKCGLWPVSPSQWEFFTFEVMRLVSTLTNFSPTTSLSAIVQAMNFNAVIYGSVGSLPVVMNALRMRPQTLQSHLLALVSPAASGEVQFVYAPVEAT